MAALDRASTAVGDLSAARTHVGAGSEDTRSLPTLVRTGAAAHADFTRSAFEHTAAAIGALAALRTQLLAGPRNAASSSVRHHRRCIDGCRAQAVPGEVVATDDRTAGQRNGECDYGHAPESDTGETE
jgi:hypothetical protein